MEMIITKNMLLLCEKASVKAMLPLSGQNFCKGS